MNSLGIFDREAFLVDNNWQHLSVFFVQAQLSLVEQHPEEN